MGMMMEYPIGLLMLLITLVAALLNEMWSMT